MASISPVVRASLLSISAGILVLVSLPVLLRSGDKGSAPEVDSHPYLSWPAADNTSKPWVYWHWMGSAVDPDNLGRELRRYADAGLGGVHVIPIYGARGYEDRYIKYLSPRWMEMFSATLAEARRLGMGVDMTLGTGWNFGGPDIGDRFANANAVVETVELEKGETISARFDRSRLQALEACTGNHREDILGRVRPDGSVDYTAPGRTRIYAVSQRPSGNLVDRAAPGDEGPMLNPFFREAVTHYLRRFEPLFPAGTSVVPRAFYHDSYEYKGDWSPDLFAQFEKRRGYRLQEHLDALFGAEDDDRGRRIRADYRETISDLLVEEFMPSWTRWARERGALARNQAHGSPGNLLDLYAAADIPETEMFRRDRDILVSKFASSAAHVAGRRLVAAETGTWIAEHFTETLGELKRLIDELFLSGVNHIFYHGTCYSPDGVPWPGWLFYASTQMNPRNPIWRDVPVLNAYVTRCQSVLQSGSPDNDILLYWPIHTIWDGASARLPHFGVHRREWLTGQPVGTAANRLWKRGYSFDFVSDRQLAAVSAQPGEVRAQGGCYRLVVVPACRVMPETTLARLVSLAEDGATVAFERDLPRDVPGWGNLERRRAALRESLSRLKLKTEAEAGVQAAKAGRGRVLVGDLEAMLEHAGIRRESLVDNADLSFVRSKSGEVTHYFLANSSNDPVTRWVPLAANGGSVVLMDPMTGASGIGESRLAAGGLLEVRVSMQPGESLIVRVLPEKGASGPRWPYWVDDGTPTELAGPWKIRFVEGGPETPRSVEIRRLVSWTALDDPEAHRFGGTAVYATRLKPPMPGATYAVELGRVCQSARVRLNGRSVGAAIVSPFRVILGVLPEGESDLEIEVTSTAANRIRDLDRRGAAWKIFHNINFVNIDYKPFDASGWSPHDAGLLGPVTLHRLRKDHP
ncbi:MAG: glycoside hydrolase [Acidobacteria bacterium]|nr:glycoside hydrolase [Acidobacteriota bacterium]